MHLMKNTPEKYQTALYETLSYHACKNKDWVIFDQLLKKYKALESFLDRFIPIRFEFLGFYNMKVISNKCG